jgi:hypothetical protein
MKALAIVCSQGVAQHGLPFFGYCVEKCRSRKIDLFGVKLASSNPNMEHGVSIVNIVTLQVYELFIQPA